MLVALLLINALFIKIYSESIEHEVKNYLEYMNDTDDLKKVVENFTIYNNRGSLSGGGGFWNENCNRWFKGFGRAAAGKL